MYKPAALLAFAVGAMSIVAGGMVIKGWRPGYSVLSWLPVYNFAAGLLTLVPAVLLWIKNRYALAVSLGAFTLHAVVLFLLLTIFRGGVAVQSIGAMSFRGVVWLIILALIMFKR
ncbi:MAG: hypothetical protein DYG86_10215 [Chloroflexi bacterium CFX2]|nr:hypothetical protein [Chloroflexi bacterium CFX2]